jgi:hypothetical protein
MGSEIRYIFGDVLSNRVIEEIPCHGVTMSEGLDGGEFRGSFNLDMTHKDNADLVAASIPGKCYVVAERNGVPIWGGMDWSRTYQSQAKSVQLYAKTMDQVLAKRVITTDLTYTAMDRRNIFRELLLEMQSDPNAGNLIIPDAFGTLAPVDMSFAGSELKTYKEAADQVSTVLDGFEWRVNVTRQDGVYYWAVIVGSPRLGQPLTDASVVFEYPGNVLNYWQNDTIGGAGTNIFGMGAGEGDSMSQVEVVHTDLLSAGGFPRLDQTITFKDVDDIDQLEALTLYQANLRKTPMPVYTVEMKADREPEFGNWAIGDYCRLAFKDPLHSEGLTYATRILKWDFTPPSADATEEVRLTFEGEDIGE